MSLYVTISEFKQAPTAIDVSTLDSTAIGDDNAQDTALLNVLRRASSWVDNIVKMDTLEATDNTEIKEMNFTRDLRLVVHPTNVPVLDVQNVQYRLAPNVEFVAVDQSLIQPFENWFTVYGVNTGMIGQNLYVNVPLGYINPYYKDRLLDMPVTIKYTYTNGYFNSVLDGKSAAGDTTLKVLNALGLTAGSRFTVYDGAVEEDCVVDSVTDNTITLRKPLLFAHQNGTSVSALPAVVKQATILLASYLIKERGSVAITMAETSLGAPNANFSKHEDVEIAKELLKPLVRVVSS